MALGFGGNSYRPRRIYCSSCYIRNQTEVLTGEAPGWQAEGELPCNSSV